MTVARAPLSGTVPAIELRDISKRFVKSIGLLERAARAFGADIQEETVHAVDRVNLQVSQGEVLGLVGESGCGKSTVGRMVAGILEPTSGTLAYCGNDVRSLRGKEAKAYALDVQMIFQDPFGSLSPRLRVEDIIGEAPMVHGVMPRTDLSSYVEETMQLCGLDPSYKRRFPHQFSGGQRQRIGIARALAVKPRFLVCDEAVAALDVSIQAQMLNLFMKLREELGLTYIFISHDLGVVEHLSDRVAIMYLGRIVESAPADEVFARANHPYTQALLREIPRITTRARHYSPIKGEIPSPINPPPGCHFHPRCPHAFDRCRVEVPALRQIASGHLSACHLNDTP